MSNILTTPRTYIITAPIATVYKTNKSGQPVIVEEKPKGSLFEINSYGTLRKPSGNIEQLIGVGGNWINKSDATLYVPTEKSEILLQNIKNSTTDVNNASTNITSTTSSNQPVTKKSYKNIIVGVIAIGLVFGLLKWKKVI
jgi:hypothetical protein